MKRFLSVALVIFALFLCEDVLFSLIGGWFKPNLILLGIIFFNLSFGVRYGIIASLIGGLLKDSFATSFFGTYTLSFMACSYAIVFARQYFLQLEGVSFRYAMVFLVSLLHVFLVYIINSIFLELSFRETFVFILLPEVLATGVVSLIVFDILKKCVSKLSV